MKFGILLQLSFLLALLLSSLSLAAFSMTDELRSMCEQAEQLINARRFNEAEQVLQRAGSIDPNCAEVHGYLGMAYQNSLKTKMAIDEYQQALQLNPQMSFIKVNLGTCLMNMNQMEQAEPYFEQYLQENPNAPDAAQVRGYIQQSGARQGQQGLRSTIDSGQALLNQHKYREACAVFEQAISQQPNFAMAHFYLGFALGQSGQNQRAIAEFQTSVQLDPNLKEALLNIGSNYQSIGDCANAITWYERYLSENPGSAKAGEIRQRLHGLRQQLTQQGNGHAGQQQSGMANAAGDDYFAQACNGGHCYRWRTMPIRVFIANGAGTFGYQDSYFQVLMDAYSKWAVASENRLAFTQVSDPSQAEIVCDWTGDPNKVVEAGRGVEGGLTKLSGQPQANGDVMIASARITLLTNRAGQSLSDDDMKKVCLHEVGHALGINGHSNNNSDIMFFSESPTVWPALTKRDKATICHLYSSYPRLQ